VTRAVSPEPAHQVTWLMGERGIPRTWRHMNGYGSHTYMSQDAAGPGFSYADAHRARLGVNYKQIPVSTPKVPVHSYSKDGAMAKA